jgi:hypothetical protein
MPYLFRRANRREVPLLQQQRKVQNAKCHDYRREPRDWA